MVIPMMLSFIVTIIYNITDAFFIGKLDNTAMMASVTLALAFSCILMALGHLFGVGAGTYVSRLLGEGNSESAKKVCSINFWSSILTGIIFMALCLPLLSPLLQILGAKGDCSTIFAGLSALFTGIFQAFGTGVQSTVMSSLRGVILIPILIFGNLLFAVNGVIWANTISEGLTCLVGLILFLGIWKRINLAYS
ncbi:MATE family efflux transporter [Desulfosporosinus nitroreducens]|uniref:MATE family efflux transporter n=1 Tax=Desulfosporosinus nitroreducens TaxID=2018668 RepID=UPI00402468ED